MRIAIFKTFTFNGVTCFAGTAPDVTPETAIAAVLANATDDPAAIALADAAGAKSAASKSIDSMKAADVKKELKRILAGKPDAALQAQVEDLKADVTALTTEKDGLSDQLTSLTEDTAALLETLGTDPTLDISERIAAANETAADLQAKLALSGTGEAANEEAMTALLTAYNAAAPEGEQVETLADITAALQLAAGN